MEKIDLFAELDAIVSQRAEAHQPTPKSWIVAAAIERHQAIKGADSDWYKHCAHIACHAEAGRVVRKYKPSEEPDKQQALPGLEGYLRVQRIYSVERGGEQVVVHALDLTDAEIDAKSVELKAMAAGCIEHADELQRFKSDRHAKGAA